MDAYSAVSQQPAVNKAVLVDSDPLVGLRVSRLLDGRGFDIANVTATSNLSAALASQRPDVILLTCTTPDDGILAICSVLRDSIPTPVVVCARRGTEEDISAALEAGADDYFVVPMRPMELVARLRAILRRTTGSGGGGYRPGGERLSAGDIEMSVDEHRVYRRGVRLELSPTEFRLLASLLRETGRPVTHRRLLSLAWGPGHADSIAALKIYIRKLRAKLEDDPERPTLILSERGIGYRLQPAITNAA